MRWSTERPPPFLQPYSGGRGVQERDPNALLSRCTCGYQISSAFWSTPSYRPLPDVGPAGQGDFGEINIIYHNCLSVLGWGTGHHFFSWAIVTEGMSPSRCVTGHKWFSFFLIWTNEVIHSV